MRHQTKTVGDPRASLWLIADECLPHDRNQIGTGYPWRHLHTILDSIDFPEYFFTYVSASKKYKRFATKTEGKKRKLIYTNGKYPLDINLITELRHLINNIQEHKPEIIVTMGDLALWAILSLDSAAKWRGSQLYSEKLQCKVIPVQSPLLLDTMWQWRIPLTVDFKRVASHSREHGSHLIPDITNYILWPSYTQANIYLNKLLIELEEFHTLVSCDIETSGGMIFCLGFCYTPLEAICIPFNSQERPNLYNDYQFNIICMLIRKILEHPNCEIIGQNFNYDRTYIFEELLCFPLQLFDTMVAQHIMFPGTTKGLDYLSSIYCNAYIYWKDERKEALDKNSEEIEYLYNCKDVKNTLEVAVEQKLLLSSMSKWHLYNEFSPILEPLQLLQADGVKVDLKEKESLNKSLGEAKEKLQEEINLLASATLNPNSPKQCMEFFYDRCNLKPYKNRKSGKPTLADKYIEQLGKREPLLQPLTDRITEFRSFGVLKSNTVDAELWPDDRMHCSYNATGTSTFRLSSSKDPYRRGCNNQNITERAAGINLRRIFIPEEDFTWVSMDLDRADLQVVAWESGDEPLKEILRTGADVWTIEAAAFLNKPESEIIYLERHYMKERVHATNYGATARTLAIQFGTKISEASAFMEKWYARHPAIANWQEEIEMEMMGGRITNIFDYTWTIFSQINNSTLNEALAWKPQSTVAIQCHRMMLLLYNKYKRHRDIFRFTLQLHDEVGFQIKTSLLDEILPEIKQLVEIPIPYKDPLIIPVGFKTGPSWGDLTEYKL